MHIFPEPPLLTSTRSVPPVTQRNKHGGLSTSIIIVIIAVGGLALAVIIMVSVLVYIYMSKRARKREEQRNGGAQGAGRTGITETLKLLLSIIVFQFKHLITFPCSADNICFVLFSQHGG